VTITRHAAVAAGITAAAALSLSACGAGTRRSAPPNATLVAAGTAATTGSSTVTAIGTGMASGEPDTLTISIAVSTTAAHAALALDQNNSLTAGVEHALTVDGVAAADQQTTSLSLQQNWGTSGPDGYAASDQITATLHNLSAAGRVIDDALAPAGDAARLYQASLSMSDTNPVMQAARQKAVQDAKAQAQQMANAAGGHLGNLISLTDATNEPSQPQVFGYNSAAGASQGTPAPVPLQAGQQHLSIQVTGVWQVLPGPA
jgi:uncharacterized protein YggE